MKAMWFVKLQGTEEQMERIRNVFGWDYFPRKYAYKKDAETMAKAVRDLGCGALVEKERGSQVNA